MKKGTWHPFSSISGQLVALVLAAMLPLAALLGWNLYQEARRDAEQARAEVLQLARVTAAETARFLDEARNILDGLAARPAVRALDPARCDPILKDLLAVAPRFSNAVTLRMDGEVVCSAVPAPRRLRLDPQNLVERVRAGELAVGKATSGTITGRWAVPVGRSLLDEHGRIAGLVALPIDLVRLPVQPLEEEVSRGTVVGLVAADGTILAHSREPERFVGTTVDTRRPAFGGGSGTVELEGIDGVPRVQGFVPVPGTDWMAVASLPAAQVYAAGRARVAQSALLALGALAAALLLAAHFGRRLREPVVALAATAGEVARGNRAARAPQTGVRELTEVAAQFNHMLDRLRESDAFLSQVLEGSQQGMAVIGPDCRYRAFNPHLGRIAGADPAAALGRRVGEVVGGAAGTLLQGQAMLALSGHAARTQPFVLRGMWVEAIHVPIRDVRGEVTSVLCTLQDISEQRRAEQALRRSEALLQAVADGTSDAVFVKDSKGRYQLFNRAAVEMSGKAAHEVLGRNDWALFPPEEAREVMAEDRRVLRERAAQTREETVTMAAGKRTYLTTKGPLRDAAGRVTGLFGIARDITQRKQAEDALRASEETLRLITDTIDDVFWLSDASLGEILYVSPAYERLWGRSRDSLLGSPRSLLLAVHPDDVAGVLEVFERKKDGQPFEHDYRIVRPGGEVRWIQERGFPVRAADGRALRYAGVAKDVTERKLAERSLREAEARQREVLDNMFPFVGLLSLEGAMLEVNRAPLEAAGLAREDVIGKPCAETRWFSYGAEAQERVRAAIARAARGEAVRYDETIRVAGERFMAIDLMFSPLRDAEGRVLRIVGSAVDISERKAAEIRRQATLKQMARLSRRLIEVEESERRAFSRELHDRIGQNLATLGLNLKLLRAAAGDGAAAGVLGRIDDAHALLELTTRQARDLMAELHPPALEDYGLAAALRAHAESFGPRVGIRVAFSGEDLALRLAPAVELALFRIAQEALANAAKHARTADVEVSLAATREKVTLTLADAGLGFDITAQRGGRSWGLAIMRERAAAAGIALSIDSAPGRGTRVVAEVPGDRARENAAGTVAEAA